MINPKCTTLRTMPWSHARIHEIFVVSQSLTHASDSKDLVHLFVMFTNLRFSCSELTVNIWAFGILIPYIRPSDKISSVQSNKRFFDSHYFVTSWVSLGLEWENSQAFNNVEVTMMHKLNGLYLKIFAIYVILQMQGISEFIS